MPTRSPTSTSRVRIFPLSLAPAPVVPKPSGDTDRVRARQAYTFGFPSQVSDQGVKLHADGFIAEEQELEDEEKMGSLKVTKEVIVAGKDTLEVDTDFLLVVVPILDHEVGPHTAIKPFKQPLFASATGEFSFPPKFPQTSYWWWCPSSTTR
eukprot:787894-Prorocentrum_minimum.AAC.3